LSLPSHYNIAVLAKSSLTEASTFYAQGGVAAVLDETDSIQQHIDDTMIAGHIYVNLMQLNKQLKVVDHRLIFC
jgi:aspartate oxidase